jgi:hypothetical protein
MLRSLSKYTAYRIAVSTLWFLVMVGLPLTSFPLLIRFTSSVVAPFSAIPLAFLLLIWLVPFVLDRGDFPAEIIPYIYFILVALIITGLGFFLNGYYARGRDFFDQSLRAFFTVAIGLSFYLIFAAFPQDQQALRKTLIFIYVGGVILLLWTGLEIIVLRSRPRVQDMPDWLRLIRNALAVTSPSMIFTTRVTGFAYEPSWFVRQFNLLLFPIWLAAVYLRVSIVKIRLWIFQVEDLLLVAGLIVFGSSSPRIGLVAFLASLAYLGILLLLRLHRSIINWYLKKRQQPPKRLVWAKLLLALIMLVVMIGIAASALVSYIELASQWDYRYALLLQSSLSSLDVFSMSTTEMIYRARDLAFFERVIYWLAGWEIFNDYPMGVGLGNAGFYYYDRMHGAGLESYEMRDVFYRANYLPNTKNLWTRLLAETGFIGLAVFLAWLYMLWRSAGLTRRSNNVELRIVGLAGQLFLLAFLVEGFSIDSFAMPYEWIMAGLISAGGLLYRKELAAGVLAKGPVSSPD